MGNSIHLNLLSNQFEIENGLLGTQRDICMRLIGLMSCKNDLLIRNLIGMSGESVCWINHFHFTVARTFVQRHLEKHIIPLKRKKGKEITIKMRKIIFNLGDRISRSVLINILIKNTILECTIKIYKDRKSGFHIGICTPKQVNNVEVNWLGNKDCGGCFGFNSLGSWVRCCGDYSSYFIEGGIKEREEEEITAVVSNRNVYNNKEKERQGKMNMIRNQKKVPHTIVNIPKDGVHFGFSCYDGLINLSFISLIHISVLPPPFNDCMKCIAYDFEGRFRNYSFNHKDEEGKEVSNIKEYYKS